MAWTKRSKISGEFMAVKKPPRRKQPPGNSRAFAGRSDVMDKERPINGVKPQKSEDDIQREQLGPRGVPGAPDPTKMTPQRAKKTPKHIDPGHTT
jgi:hypothetical protein